MFSFRASDWDAFFAGFPDTSNWNERDPEPANAIRGCSKCQWGEGRLEQPAKPASSVTCPQMRQTKWIYSGLLYYMALVFSLLNKLAAECVVCSLRTDGNQNVATVYNL